MGAYTELDDLDGLDFAEMRRRQLESELSTDNAPLRALIIGRLVQEIADAEDELAAHVRQARAEGHTWSQLGDLLGLSKAGAQRRYGSRAGDGE